jgi:hypothetical protein
MALTVNTVVGNDPFFMSKIVVATLSFFLKKFVQYVSGGFNCEQSHWAVP